MRQTGFVLLTLLATVTLATGTILHVPSEYATIQAGIDAAQEGDTVLVARGTYRGLGNRNIDFLGKAIEVMSESGPEVTIIDCGGGYPHRGFYFHSDEGPQSVLQGFTIKNGYSYVGGAIYCEPASPTIKGNIITENIASGGGGIYCRHCSPYILRNIITGNLAQEYGGGIRCYDAYSVIEGNIITRNIAYWGGGIAGYYPGFPHIRENIIAWNIAGYGGGIHCQAQPVTESNTIIYNTATMRGGAVYLYCTSGPSTVINSVLWGNIPEEIYLYANTEIDVTYSDVEGDWPGTGNVDLNPLLALSSYDGNPSMIPEERDYSLLWGSPCIDAGHPDSLDPDGTRRDMGACYFDQLTRYSAEPPR